MSLSAFRPIKRQNLRWLWLPSPALLVLLAAATAPGQAADYDQGLALLDKAQYAEAVPFLTRAVAARPDEARAWKALGVAYAAQAQYNLAEAPFRRACELDRKLPDACYFHGRALYALDRFQESVDVLERAASLQPKSWKIRLGIAQALEARSQPADAEKGFRQALALAQNSDPQPGSAFGLFLIRQGRTDEAVSVLGDIAQRFPASADGHVYLGRALLEQGKVAEALPHLERALALQPDSGQAHLLLAKGYVRSGRPADAEPHFEAAARLEAAGQGKLVK